MFRFLFGLLLLHLFVSLSESHTITYCADLCPPCHLEEEDCSPVSPRCKHVVMPSGCGCCMTCALNEGDRCGIGRDPCAPGLVCQGPRNTIAEIINNNATCQRISPSRKENRNQKRNPRIHARTRQARIGRRSRRHPHFFKDGPCTEHLDATTTSCAMLTERVWFPRCQLNGYYKPIQCMTFDGIKRCWCVNRRGKNQGNRFYSRQNITCN